MAALLMALAAGKLVLVRRLVPDLLQGPVAVLLGVQALLVFALPVAVVQLAGARLLAPVSLYALWWVTLFLPIARRRVADLTRGPRWTAATRAAWTWLPAASVMLHLWALGWIHQVPFMPAYLGPLLIGLAVASAKEQVEQQVALPALAVLLSLGQAEALGFPLLGVFGPPVSPLRLAVLGASAAWAILAWRHGYRRLVILAAAAGLTGLLGASVSSIAASVGAVVRFLGRLLPRDALAWGLTGVVGSFVFLALGVWRSLRDPAPAGDRPGGQGADLGG